MIIVYLGIIVPIYLKHCAIGPCIGTHILPTNKIWTTKIKLHTLSPLLLISAKGGGVSPFFTFHSLSLSFSSSPFSLISLKNTKKKRIKRRLKLPYSLKIEELGGLGRLLELAWWIWGFHSRSYKISLTFLKPLNEDWVFFGFQEHKVRNYL